MTISLRRVFSALIVASLSFISASIVSAYSLHTDESGIYVVKWSDSPVTFQIKLPVVTNLIDGSSLNGSVKTAMQLWNAQLGAVQLVGITSASTGYSLDNETNEIAMATAIDGQPFSSGTLAITISYSRANHSTESDIIFNSTYSWDSYRGGVRGGAEDIQRIALHELGHALGLNHPDENAQNVVALMNSVRNDVDRLQPDDIAGGQKAYGGPGFSPSNNHFANAEVIELSDGLTQVTGTNIAASHEAGEPQHAGSASGRSVWWKWTPLTGGIVTVDTEGSDFDSVLAVYSGASFSSLLSIASNDDAETPEENSTPQRKRTSKTTFQVEGGTTYHLAVDGWARAEETSGGYNGSILLNLSFAAVIPPYFTSHPVDKAVGAGAGAEFIARVAGKPWPTLQWQRRTAGGSWTNLVEGNGTIGVRGETLLVITNRNMDGDEFRCVGSNEGGTVPSNPAVLRVSPIPLPSITKQPQNVTWIVGYNGVVHVEATEARSFQWYHNGVLIPGKVDGGLGVSGVEEDDAGEYHVVVSNAGGSVTSETARVTVRPLAKIASVMAAESYAMFLREDGTRWKIGRAFTEVNETPKPLIGSGEFDVLGAAAGSEHDLFIQPDRTLWARGGNAYGQLGDSTNVWRFDPVKIASDVATVTAGRYVSYFVKTDGSLWGMGQNQWGLLGDGSYENRSTPVRIDESVRSVSVTLSFALYTKTDGSLWGIGSNFYGTLGNGTTRTTHALPVKIADDVVIENAGQVCSFYIKTDGSLWGMGSNTFGCLGDGTTIDRSTPVFIMNDVADVSAGYQHTLFLKKDGTLWIAGLIGYQFGLSDFAQSNVPVKVAEGVASIAAGNSRSYYVKTDGSLWATGNNQDAALGLGFASNFEATPQLVADDAIRLKAVANWPAPAAISAGTPLSHEQLNATADIFGYFQYSPPMDTVLGAGTHSLSATFYPYESAKYSRTKLQVPLTVTSMSVPTTPSTATLVNIATRAYCGTGDKVTIGGFVVGGSGPKRVLVRAVGPTLTSQGIGASEVLLDPVIEVHKGAPVIATNDNWVVNGNASDIISVAKQIGASAFAVGDNTSSALLIYLDPGVYSFIVSGKGGTSGIVLLEVYDADGSASSAQFVNIATRAYSTTGNGVTIGGFVISGNAPKQVLLRAVGPTLAAQGINQADVLADPMIELHDAHHGNVTIGTNDNWGENANATAITTTAARIGAAPFHSSDTKSSALLTTLQPGVYTFIASGKSATSGIVLVEVYDAD